MSGQKVVSERPESIKITDEMTATLYMLDHHLKEAPNGYRSVYICKGEASSNVAEAVGMRVWLLTSYSLRASYGEEGGEVIYSSIEGGASYLAEDGTYFSIPLKKYSDDEFKQRILEAYQKGQKFAE